MSPAAACGGRNIRACYEDLEAGQLLGYHFAEASQVWRFESCAGFYVLGFEQLLPLPLGQHGRLLW
jgi:hypothetical protein